MDIHGIHGIPGISVISGITRLAGISETCELEGSQTHGAVHDFRRCSRDVLFFLPNFGCFCIDILRCAIDVREFLGFGMSVLTFNQPPRFSRDVLGCAIGMHGSP